MQIYKKKGKGRKALLAVNDKAAIIFMTYDNGAEEIMSVTLHIKTLVAFGIEFQKLTC